MRRSILLFLLLAGCGRSEAPPAAPGVGAPGAVRKPRVNVVTLQEREVTFTLEASGSIEAAGEVSIPARVSGVVEALTFREGDRVDPKTRLAEIDVERFRLGQARAEAELHRAEAEARLQETLFANRRRLYDEGKRKEKEWVTAEQLAIGQADVEKANAGLEEATAQLDLARQNARDSHVFPPLEGIINRRGVARGEYVKPETVIATMLDISNLYVRFSLSETDAVRLAPDQEIRFTVRSLPGREFTARLFYVGQKADEMTRAFECKGIVGEGAAELRPGYFALVRVTTSTARALLVPERALLPTEKGYLVYVIEEGKASARQVVPGLRAEGGVQISQGLKPGDRIVTDGGAALRPGIDVEIVNKEP